MLVYGQMYQIHVSKFKVDLMIYLLTTQPPQCCLKSYGLWQKLIDFFPFNKVKWEYRGHVDLCMLSTTNIQTQLEVFFSINWSQFSYHIHIFWINCPWMKRLQNLLWYMYLKFKTFIFCTCGCWTLTKDTCLQLLHYGHLLSKSTVWKMKKKRWTNKTYFDAR